MYEAVQKKAQELGQLLTETAEYQKVKELQTQMFNDDQAMVLLKEFQKLQTRNHNKHQRNELTQEDIKEIEQAELKMLENELISNFHSAQTDLQRLLNEAMKTVMEASR